MNMLRRRLELEDALTAGLRCGLERRRPTDEERARWLRGRAVVARAFLNGRARGRRKMSRLEQLQLQLESSTGNPAGAT